ncbi:defensin beta 118 [Artibeus jamaicensis]|uniref:defensin beta 118 n=1 Tax=Artibeus jamaicensis TaxID=9417 RepID=UPI00235B0431|nr:defensin beta 118 [Artibeus jamaicensis]
MRLLLLTLAALVFLPQVTPAFGGKKCWQRMGYCRRYCKVDEEVKSACKNHRVCCVPVEKGRKPVGRGKEVPRTSSTQASHLQASPMDIVIMIPSSSSELEVVLWEAENEQSDQVLETDMSLPEVHQSS